MTGKSLADVQRSEDSSPRLAWANALRGIAAGLVLVFHLGTLFWVRQETAAVVARRDPLESVLAAPASFARAFDALPVDLGALGVGIFFLISGHVIAFSLERYSRRGFLIGRGLRVLPTYALGFLVTCATIAAVGDPLGELSVTSVAIGTVPGLRFVLGTTSPHDGVVWTLIVELVFYAICLVVHRWLTRGWLGVVSVAALCTVAQIALDPPTVLLGSTRGGLTYVVLLACPFVPLMLVGVILSTRTRGHVGVAPALVLVPGLTALHAWLLATSPLLKPSVEYWATYVVASVVFVLVWRFGSAWRPGRLTRGAAAISYPLYVAHPVLGYATLSVLLANGVVDWLALVVAVVLVVAVAVVLHLVVENPSHRFGRAAARRADRRLEERRSAKVDHDLELLSEGRREPA